MARKGQWRERRYRLAVSWRNDAVTAPATAFTRKLSFASEPLSRNLERYRSG
jgi:hypothetical protein